MRTLTIPRPRYMFDEYLEPIVPCFYHPGVLLPATEECPELYVEVCDFSEEEGPGQYERK